MKGKYSTREAAQKMGITLLTLQRHVTKGTVKAPPLDRVGGIRVRLWTAEEIRKAHKIISKIRPGRKPKGH